LLVDSVENKQHVSQVERK